MVGRPRLVSFTCLPEPCCAAGDHEITEQMRQVHFGLFDQYRTRISDKDLIGGKSRKVLQCPPNPVSPPSLSPAGAPGFASSREFASNRPLPPRKSDEPVIVGGQTGDQTMRGRTKQQHANIGSLHPPAVRTVLDQAVVAGGRCFHGD